MCTDEGSRVYDAYPQPLLFRDGYLLIAILALALRVVLCTGVS